MGLSFYILSISNILFFLMNIFFNDFILQYEMLFAIVLIALIGIPHGAIDHILFLKKTAKTKRFFYSFYFLFIFLSLIFWLYMPQFSLVLFLLLSAYHFGQSQLQSYAQLPNVLARFMSILWGISIISAFVILNFQEINELMSLQPDFDIFIALFNFELYLWIFVTSTLTLVTLAILNRFKFQLKKEILYFLLILITFYVQSAFIAFALFFVFNHSLVVLQSEHHFLSKIKKNFNIILFVKYLAPFTFISLFGIIFFSILVEIDFLNVSIPFIVLVSIASLTLPHAIVMEVFYQKD